MDFQLVILIIKKMLTTLWATVRNGKIELLDLTELPEKGRFLLSDEETDIWLQSSQTSLQRFRHPSGTRWER